MKRLTRRDGRYREAVGTLETFADLVMRPETSIPLDEAALLICQQANPGLLVAEQLERLDQLALACPGATLDDLVHHLFVDLGFTGNRADYHDPRNSYLDAVLDRRVGIPITLSVLAISVGRRLGVPLLGIGMPGHFLVRDERTPDVFIDPFARGAVLDEAGCELRFHALHGDDVAFDRTCLAPVGNLAILARVLRNLRGVFEARGDRANLEWVLRLRGVMPDVSPEERSQLATVLAASGRFGEAAAELERLGDHLGGDLGAAYRGSARLLRARLN